MSPIIRSKSTPARRSGARRVGAALLTAAVGAAVWGTLIERQLFTVRRHTLPVLPAGAAPLRVLHLSDLHLAPWQARKIDWVRSLARLNPDLVILTGDLMGHVEAREPLAYALEPLTGIPGVFVHGSNDYYGPIMKSPLRYLRKPSRMSSRPKDIDTAALTHALTDGLGFTDLNNSATLIEARGTTLELFGLGDPHIGYDRPTKMIEAHAALDNSAVDHRVPIGVVHAPYQESLGVLLREGADVIFAGHTHGGQVRVPFVGALTSNCDLSLSQARGLSVWFDAERQAFLNVSAGLGNSIYAPVRFACRPEASLLTLEARG